MMSSNLITKARNILVEIHLNSNGVRIAGKIIDFDQEFVEVLVKVDERSGEFVASRGEFSDDRQGLKDDRVLISLSDISVIA